jgi:hypothetical protein
MYPVLIVLAGLATAAPRLSAERWLAPAGRLAALTTRPAECLAVPPGEDAVSFEIGRVAFRTPLLLGGQAARVGLACETCHRGGRNNPAFLFPGLSGAPGTADVTSSLMSSHRGNGVFDPKVIPDLTRPGKIGRDPHTSELGSFIRGLVVEEFDGAEPPRRVLAGLVAYVRSLRAEACPAAATEQIRVAVYLEDMRRATEAAIGAWREGDSATARLMLSGARTALGLIDERFASPGLERDRRELRNADLGLLAIQQALDRGEPDIDVRVAAWSASTAAWTRRLRRDEPRSLFNAKNL